MSYFSLSSPPVTHSAVTNPSNYPIRSFRYLCYQKKSHVTAHPADTGTHKNRTKSRGTLRPRRCGASRAREYKTKNLDTQQRPPRDVFFLLQGSIYCINQVNTLGARGLHSGRAGSGGSGQLERVRRLEVSKALFDGRVPMETQKRFACADFAPLVAKIFFGKERNQDLVSKKRFFVSKVSHV